MHMDQLSVAAYVRLQLQNTKDESRGILQTCTVRSNERSLRSGRAAKFHFCKKKKKRATHNVSELNFKKKKRATHNVSELNLKKKKKSHP